MVSRGSDTIFQHLSPKPRHALHQQHRAPQPHTSPIHIAHTGQNFPSQLGKPSITKSAAFLLLLQTTFDSPALSVMGGLPYYAQYKAYNGYNNESNSDNGNDADGPSYDGDSFHV